MSDLDRLASALETQNQLLMAQLGVGQKAAANFQTAQALHGPNGLWTGAGLDQSVISTHVKPRGLGSVIPAFPNFDTNPQFAFLTGISDDIGAEPVNVCDDAPTGYMKGGYLTARFGRVIRDTNTIEIGATLRKLHRGDFTDLQLVGNLMSDASGLMFPSDINAARVLDLVTISEMVNVGTRMERKLAPMVWQGSPANNVGQGYQEFPGLDNQITTGHLDNESGSALPSADSLVVNANFTRVTDLAIVAEVEAAMDFTETLADDTVGGVEGAVVLRPDLWREISEVWPCQYNTGQCAPAVVGDASRVVIDGRDNIRERNQMRQSLTIQINSRTYPVVLDNGIHRHTNATNGNVPAGHFSSNIYFVPFRINGNLPVTYWQHIDFRAAAAEIAQLNGQQEFWTDAGRFLWSYNGVYSCFKLKARVEPRVILRTPQLAWRIDNILYAPKQVYRDWDPKSPYHVDGGVSLRPAPTQNAVWL